MPILMVIDHHQPQDRLNPQFSDIRQAGSTATIYMLPGARRARLDSAHKDHVLAATALMTASFRIPRVHSRSADDRAAAYLSRFRDVELLGQILSQAFEARHGHHLSRFGNREIVESISVADRLRAGRGPGCDHKRLIF
jgi:nanoRNase/pAp phosphatase (c-di-AMP/oligoRNAs hydrolase)